MSEAAPAILIRPMLAALAPSIFIPVMVCPSPLKLSAKEAIGIKEKVDPGAPKLTPTAKFPVMAIAAN